MNDVTATPKPLPKGTQQTPRIAVNDAPAILQSLVMAGWTGRNAAELEAHIRELEALGVPRPEATPIYFRCPSPCSRRMKAFRFPALQRAARRSPCSST